MKYSLQLLFFLAELNKGTLKEVVVVLSQYIMPVTDTLHYCLVLCRFMQFDASSYETSPEIYALEEKVQNVTSHLPQAESKQLKIKCMECTKVLTDLKYM